MKINKYKITAVLFLVIIFWIGTVTLWNNRTEFKNMIHSGDVINETNKIYSENVAYSDTFIDMWSKTQSVTDVQLLDDAEYGNIIKDEKGNLYFPANDVDVTSLAQNTINFAKMLSEKNIKFAYVQAPNKDLKGYTDKIVSDYNFSNKNADEFLSILNENGVDTLDLRELIIKENLDREKLFYKTDHHWTSDGAYYAYEKWCEDTGHEAAPLDALEKTVESDKFRGSLYSKILDAGSAYDEIWTYGPKDGAPFGSENCLVTMDEKDETDSVHDRSKLKEKDKYAFFFGGNYGEVHVQNQAADEENKGRNVLVIKDSFANSFAPFLTQNYENIYMIDLRYYNGDLKAYLHEHDITDVLVLYNISNFISDRNIYKLTGGI